MYAPNNKKEEEGLNKIPLVAHFIWLGTDPLPDDFQYYQDKFRKLHPDWTVCTWTDQNIPLIDLPNQAEFLEARGVVLKVDILKINLLYLYGGVFVDFDMEFFKPLDTILDDSITCFSCGEQEGIIGNAILGATPQHPTFQKLIRALPQSIKENRGYGPNVVSGPVFYTKTLNKSDIHLFPSHYFFPTRQHSKNDLEAMYPDSIANHHFQGSWVGKEDLVKDWNDYLKNDKVWKEEYES